ncbi:MAG: TetR/AcrR family transcriptional regulator [Chloroflexota bacterium]|nr:MAG: TetR/AcrR family transcriptional regulator [Chloroflexota bacterium]
MARTLEFDPEAALNKAMEYFWLHGYDAGNMRDLASFMGISKGSFYNTYGSKKEVYLAALNSYLEGDYQLLAQMLAQTPPAAELLPALFANVTARFGDKDKLRGSFLVNAAVERAPHDPAVRRAIADHFERFQGLLAGYFGRLQEQGGLPPRFEPQVYAQALISTLFSIGVLSNLNLGQQATDNVVMVALAIFE